MKRIFCIISAVIIGIVGSFLTTLSIKKTTIAEFDEPFAINVYNMSSTTANNTSYYDTDDIYHEVTKNLQKTLTSSLFTVMINDGRLTNKPNYGGNNYATYDTSMKQRNLVIELIYKETKDIIVYENGNTRVIAYVCLLMIIPCASQYEEIVCYTALSNSSEKDTEYKNNKPFVLKGNPKELLKYVNSIDKGESKS